MILQLELKESENHLILGHNLLVMNKLAELGYSRSFQLIYFDGPFNSGRIFSTPHPRLGVDIINSNNEKETMTQFLSPESYLEEYRSRLQIARELLHDEGFLVLQCNQKEGHYLKTLLDEIMGRENFLTEVIWKISGEVYPKSSQFGYQHENIFFYSKTRNYLKKEISPISSIWDDIGYYETLDEEDTFYPSQKPVKLMERILHLTTNEGHLVGDFYCGSGTFPYTADLMGRKWIACDQNQNAVKITGNRFMESGRNANFYESSLLVSHFNEEWLNGNVYRKPVPVPISALELKSLQNSYSAEPIIIQALSYSGDVDLMNHDGLFQFNLLVPLITPDGISFNQWTTVPRPTPAVMENGFDLYVQHPFEWVLHNILHVKRNDLKNGYLFDWLEVQQTVNDVLKKVDGKWIDSIESHDSYVKLTDVFGYVYHLDPNKNVTRRKIGNQSIVTL